MDPTLTTGERKHITNVDVFALQDIGWELLFPVQGDMNGDGNLTLADAGPLVLALVDRAAFDSAYPSVDADAVGDVDGSGTFDLGDLSAFSGLLGGPASSEAVPEPSAIVLALLALAGVAANARRARPQSLLVHSRLSSSADFR